MPASTAVSVFRAMYPNLQVTVVSPPTSVTGRSEGRSSLTVVWTFSCCPTHPSLLNFNDLKPEEGEAGDSVDNDNSSTNGISNNIMVIVFCALAFVANGGFLVYVFWVM